MHKNMSTFLQNRGLLIDCTEKRKRKLNSRALFYIALPISTASDIKSALGVIRFALDSREYSNVSLCYLTAFYYRQGYENTLQLICEHEYLEQGAYYDTGFTESNFLRNTNFYISAYDNRTSLNYKDVTVEGVEWGAVEFAGETYTTTDTTVYCSKGLQNGTSRASVIITAFSTNDLGEEVCGFRQGISKSKFTISGYAAPEE